MPWESTLNAWGLLHKSRCAKNWNAGAGRQLPRTDSRRPGTARRFGPAGLIVAAHWKKNTTGHMQNIQTDVTAKADQVSTDAAKVEGYAKAAQYLIGYNEKNILTVFLYEE